MQISRKYSFAPSVTVELSNERELPQSVSGAGREDVEESEPLPARVKLGRMAEPSVDHIGLINCVKKNTRDVQLIRIFMTIALVTCNSGWSYCRTHRL